MSVRLQRQAIERLKSEEAYAFLENQDLSDLQRKVAPLVRSDEEDVFALRFDALMYGLICAVLEGTPTGSYLRKVAAITTGLQERLTIPQVKERLPILKRVCEEGFLQGATALELEEVRQQLRDIVRFLGGGEGRKVIYTSLSDPVTSVEYGVTVEPDEDFEDYRLKVSHYLAEYDGKAVIRKLHTNQPLTQADFVELERIFTSELGTAEDYREAYGETPFGLLVRTVVKLDHDAAMAAFAEFINDEGLTAQQRHFVHRIVDYVEDIRLHGPPGAAPGPLRPPPVVPEALRRGAQATARRHHRRNQGERAEARGLGARASGLCADAGTARHAGALSRRSLPRGGPYGHAGERAPVRSGILRLSLPHDSVQAMIREVHVYGRVAGLHLTESGGAQHAGLGRQLIERASTTAAEAGYTCILVISSVGTRNYYRSLGFSDRGLYQGHTL